VGDLLKGLELKQHWLAAAWKPLNYNKLTAFERSFFAYTRISDTYEEIAENRASHREPQRLLATGWQQKRQQEE
jgi:hypothetical protein